MFQGKTTVALWQFRQKDLNIFVYLIVTKALTRCHKSKKIAACPALSVTGTALNVSKAHFTACSLSLSVDCWKRTRSNGRGQAGWYWRSTGQPPWAGEEDSTAAGERSEAGSYGWRAAGQLAGLTASAPAGWTPEASRLVIQEMKSNIKRRHKECRGAGGAEIILGSRNFTNLGARISKTLDLQLAISTPAPLLSETEIMFLVRKRKRRRFKF